MHTAIEKAIDLILSGNAELLNILAVTARMCIASSLLAMLIGLPIGIALGAWRSRFRHVFTVISRTLMGVPPVVCGLLFYILFSGVGPFRSLHLLFTVKIMILAQVVLITPLVISTIETYVSGIITGIRETVAGLQLSRGKTVLLLLNECMSSVFTTYLLSFARSIAEVGAVSMVGGAIAWKTNVMTTAIMQYTNRGDFSLGIALGLILMSLSLLVNIAITALQGGVNR